MRDRDDTSKKFALDVEYGINNRVFDATQQLRIQVEPDQPYQYAFDEYSYHYVLKNTGRPVGCLTVTREKDGPIDCRDAYPARMLRRFRDVIVSSVKLRMLSTEGRDVNPAWRLNYLFREAWRDQFRRGARLDLINVVGRIANIYSRRMGYHVMVGKEFIHSQLGTFSHCMFLSADPSLPSIAQDIFRSSDDQLPYHDVVDSMSDDEDQDEGGVQ